MIPVSSVAIMVGIEAWRSERITPMAIGYIYVLSNPAMGALLKVGFTRSSVEKRAAELSGATGVPSPFVVEYFQLTDDVEAVERLVHEALPRVSENREFFAVPVHEAIAAIQQHAMLPATEYQRPHGLDAMRSAPPHVCRRCGHPFERSTAQQFCPKCGF
jgi:T5orf172 domain